MNEKRNETKANERRGGRGDDGPSNGSTHRLRSTTGHEPKTRWDALLSVYPANLFHLRLVQEIARSERYRHFLGLILVHVERPARLAGETDITLLKVERDLTKGLSRRTDILCKYQREQFVVLLPETDKQGTQIVINRFRAIFPSHDCRFHYRSISFPEDASNLEMIVDRIEEFSSEMYRKNPALRP